MLGTSIHMACLLLVAGLFVGMSLFSAGFAALLLQHLPPAETRMLIRKAFPPFYLFVIVSSGVASLLAWPSDPTSSAQMAVVMLTAVAARQLLMPAINRATDMGHKSRFVCLHGLSVVLTLAHSVLAGVVLVHLAR
jgi:hypothetical protein